MNVNPIFAQNVDYVFYAQQAVERFSIERQISMSMSHGGLTTNEKGESTLIPSDDAINIFQKIPGTPAYWKVFRNELYGRLEQKGPFHWFFTLSCAEMRWACVLIEVLKVLLGRRFKVMYMNCFEKNQEGERINVSWNGEKSTVLIYDKGQNFQDSEHVGKKATNESDDCESEDFDVEDSDDWEEERKTCLKEEISKYVKTTIDFHKKEETEPKDYITRLHNSDDDKKNLIDFVVTLETSQSQLKLKDVLYIAEFVEVSERKNIINFELYLNRYLKVHSLSMTDFLKDHFLMITRIFDKRAHDFMDTVMIDEGIEDYTFRVEMQMRGLPHVSKHHYNTGKIPLGF